MEYIWRLIFGGRGGKRKAEDAFQSGEDEAEESLKQDDTMPAKRLKTTEFGHNSDTDTSSPEKDNTSSVGRGQKRKAEDAFLEVEHEKREPPKTRTMQESNCTRRVLKIRRNNPCKGTFSPEMDNTSSVGRGQKRKAEDAFLEVEHEKREPPKTRTMQAPNCTRRVLKIRRNNDSKGTFSPEMAQDNTSSGGRGKKRKAEDVFQSGEDEGKESQEKRMKTTRLKNEGGNSAPNTSSPKKDNSSSGGRGRKREAEDAFQSGQDEGKESLKQEKRMKTTTLKNESGNSAPNTSSPKKDNPSSVSPLDKYEIGKRLGKGSSGTVYMGTRKSDGQKVAIKFIHKSKHYLYIRPRGFPRSLISEVAVMLAFKKPPFCPHIIEFYEYLEEGDYRILVLEYPYPCMTLAKFIRRNNGRLSESIARHLILQLLIAGQQCYEHDVAHSSMHEENVLVNPKTLHLKLIDFSSSVFVRSKKPYLLFFFFFYCYTT
ncbi:serine threonine- kinase pim-2-like protein [Labeo rohita]|uniref:non-specific serine/threonine protein kinase n=1 Tax=Labeo rohita TaxID=84645 RepID=A0A498M9W4_LABRO|nr:serine threonine- kinase pim-2-like protein [Labeo rohita]